MHVQMHVYVCLGAGVEGGGRSKAYRQLHVDSLLTIEDSLIGSHS